MGGVVVCIISWNSAIKQRRSPKSSKSQTIEEIVVYQLPADESWRWTSSNDRDSVDMNAAIYIHIYSR